VIITRRTKSYSSPGNVLFGTVTRSRNVNVGSLLLHSVAVAVAAVVAVVLVVLIVQSVRSRTNGDMLLLLLVFLFGDDDDDDDDDDDALCFR
jgi:hypothetical protein